MARSFLASTTLAMMLCAASAIGSDLDTGELLLLAVEIERETVAESIAAYEVGGVVYLPLGSLAEILGFAIAANPSSRTASGFFMDETRTFTVDLAAGTAEIRGERIALAPGDFQVSPEDLYLRIDRWEAWFPLRVGVNRGASVLVIKPLEPLPAQERMRRHLRAGRGKPEEVTYPVFEPDTLWSRPGIRQQFRARAADLEGLAPDPVVYSSTSAAGTLLNADYRIFVSADSSSKNLESRVTAGRRSAEARLLGPLRARAWEIGDIHSPGFDLISSSSSGVGASVSNWDPALLGSRAGTRTLRGDAPPGWDVELHRESEMLGFVVVDDDGIWEFRDIPLRVGLNTFRVVAHGPHGEVVEENYSFQSSSTFIPAGSVAYQVLTISPDDGLRSRDLHLGQLRFGLGAGSVGELVVAGGEGRRQVARGGISSSFAGMLGEILYAAEAGGETAFSVNLQRRGRRFGYFVGHREYGAGYDSGGADPTLRSSSALRIDWSAIGRGRALPLSLSLSRQQRHDGDSTTAARVAASARQGAFHLSGDLGSAWSESGKATADGRLYVSRPVGVWTVRAGAQYEFAPDFELMHLQFRGERYRGDGRSLVLSVTQPRDGEHRLSAGIRQSIRGVGLELLASVGEESASVDLGISFGFIPVGRGWALRPESLVDDDGMARIELFVDRDRDGERDPDEPPVPGASVEVDGRPAGARTDADGVIVLAGLPTRRYVTLTIRPRDLPDPLMMPAVEGIRVRARETVPTAVPLPILLTSEIYGHVFFETGEPAPGVEVILRGSGRAISVRSEFDGFLQWIALPPGDYSVEVPGGAKAPLNLTLAEGQVVDGIEIVVGVTGNELPPG